MSVIYLTYEQWNRLGYQVKKGEKATRFGGLTVEPSLKFSEHQVKPKQKQYYDHDDDDDMMYASESDIY